MTAAMVSTPTVFPYLDQDSVRANDQNTAFSGKVVEPVFSGGEAFNTCADARQKVRERQKDKALFLKSIFTGVATGVAVKAVAQSVVGLSSLSGPAGIFASAALTGVIMTGLEVGKDYRQARNALEMTRGAALRSLFNKKSGLKYLKKFGISSVGGMLGAGAVWGLDTEMGQVVKSFVAEHAGGIVTAVGSVMPSGVSDRVSGAMASAKSGLSNLTASVKNMNWKMPSFSSWLPSISALKPTTVTSSVNAVEPEVAFTPEPSAEELTAATDRSMDVATVIDNIDRVTMATWDDQALSDLDSALDGNLASIDNLALRFYQGGGDFTVDPAKADALYNIMKDAGYSISDDTLAEYNGVRGIEATEVAQQSAPASEPPAADGTPAVGAGSLEALIADIDKDKLTQFAQARLENAQAGKPWAIQDLAHFAQNGLQGFEITEANSNLAKQLATINADNGYQPSSKFLAQLEGHTASPAVASAPAVPVEVTEVTEKHVEKPAPTGASRPDVITKEELDAFAQAYPELPKDAEKPGLAGFSNEALQAILHPPAPAPVTEPVSALNRQFCKVSVDIDVSGQVVPEAACSDMDRFGRGENVIVVEFEDGQRDQATAQAVRQFVRETLLASSPVAALR